eukprot:g1033.t1
MWGKIRGDLEGNVSSEELEAFDKMFQDIPDDEKEKVKELVGRSLVLAAAGVDLSKEDGGEGEWIQQLLRKDATDGNITDEESNLFGKHLLATMNDDLDALFVDKYAESVGEKLEEHGIRSKRPVAMINEAISSLLQRDDVKEHFEEWSDRAQKEVEELGMDENASISEMREALRKSGTLDQVGEGLFPHIKPNRGEGEGFLDAMKEYTKDLTMRLAARKMLLLNNKGDDTSSEASGADVGETPESGENEVSESDHEEATKKLIERLGPLMAGGKKSIIHGSLDRVRSHLREGGYDEMYKFAVAMHMNDTNYLDNLLGTSAGATAGAAGESKQRSRDMGVRDFDSQDLSAMRSEMTPEELALEDEALKRHAEEPYAEEGWMMREWIKWNEEKGRDVVDPGDSSNWLRSMVGVDEDGNAKTAADLKGPEPLRLPHSMAVPDLTIQVMSRRQLRRIFEIYDEVREQQLEVEKKRPVDDLLALRAQPPEFVGDARIRYSFKDYVFAKSHSLEKHPGEDYVQLMVNLNDLPMNDEEKEALKDVVGLRFNRASGDITISSQKFPMRLHNRIHVRLVLDRAMQAAKSIATEASADEASA